jgi:MFS family permease
MAVTEPQATTAAPPRDLRRELALFLMVVAALGVTSGIFETTFNNFLNDTFRITAEARGVLEFPRELPGFLVALLGGALFFLTEIRLGVLAAATLTIGLIGLACWGNQSYGIMILFMFLWSVGNHLMMPVNNTINLSLAPPGKRASRMGQIGALAMVTTIVGSGLVWVGLQYVRLSYRALFIVAGACAFAAMVAVSRIRPLPARQAQRPKLVLKRRYSLYYLLCVFSGARKQIFITFGPWVLIKIFGEPASTIAKLWIVASLIGIVFQPQLGKLIDRLGERAILMADAVMIMAVCVGYGFAERMPLGHPVYLVYTCYVLDNVLFACGIARTTYMDKIAESDGDVHASLSLGVTIDHAVSMSLPAAGGLLWSLRGGNASYPLVFVAAAIIAFGNLIAASFVRPGGHARPSAEAEAEAAAEQLAVD